MILEPAAERKLSYRPPLREVMPRAAVLPWIITFFHRITFLAFSQFLFGHYPAYSKIL